MTREEAKAWLEHHFDPIPDGTKQSEAVSLAIKALEQEPKCRDCVSRDYLLSIANKDGAYGYVSAHEIINAPSVNPQPKTGHWMRKTKVDGVYDIAGVKTWGGKCQCNKCDFTTTVIEGFGYYNYCPNCGAKMVESQESEG